MACRSKPFTNSFSLLELITRNLCSSALHRHWREYPESSRFFTHIEHAIPIMNIGQPATRSHAGPHCFPTGPPSDSP